MSTTQDISMLKIHKFASKEQYEQISSESGKVKDTDFCLVPADDVGKKTPEGGEIFNSAEAAAVDAHAEGTSTGAYGMSSHAEGSNTSADGFASHAEGFDSVAENDYSHAEGLNTRATGIAAHAEGDGTHASGYSAHAEGYGTYAFGKAAHAEGHNTRADGQASHVSGYNTVAIGDYTTATGKSTSVGIYGFKLLSIYPNDDYTEFEIEIDLPDDGEHVVPYTKNDLLSVDCSNHVYDKLKIIEQVPNSVQKVTYRCCTVDGQPITNFKVDTKDDGSYNDDPWENWVFCLAKPHPEHSTQVLSGEGAYVGGVDNKVVGRGAFAHGRDLQAIGDYSFAEGRNNYAAYSAHAEGKGNKATGYYSHAEGELTEASGPEAHAEGYSTIASAKAAHAEGYANNAFAPYSHAEGQSNTVQESAIRAHVEGYNNIASYPSQHVGGRFNKPVNYAWIIGNGSPDAIVAGGEESHNLIKENDWKGINSSITKYTDAQGKEWFDFDSTGNAIGIKQTFEGKKGAIYTLRFHVDGVDNPVVAIPSGVYIGLWFFKDSAVNDNCVSTQLADLSGGELQCQIPDDANIVEVQIGNNSGVTDHYRFGNISLTEKVGLIYQEEFNTTGLTALEKKGWTLEKGNDDTNALGVFAGDPGTGWFYNSTPSFFMQINNNSKVYTPKFTAIPGTKYTASMMTCRVTQDSHGTAEFVFLDSANNVIQASGCVDITNQDDLCGYGCWYEHTISEVAPEGAVQWYISFKRASTTRNGDVGLDHLMIFDSSKTANYENRANAATIDWNGDAWFAGNLTLGSKNRPVRATFSGVYTPDPTLGNDGDIYIRYAE